MGAAAEGPHSERKVPPVLLEATHKFTQICIPPYHGHQDNVFYYTVVCKKASEVNIAAGINQAHVEWVKLRLAN
jgi:hypothetical protein